MKNELEVFFKFLSPSHNIWTLILQYVLKVLPHYFRIVTIMNTTYLIAWMATIAVYFTLKFRYSERVTKIWKPPTYLWNYLVLTSKQNGSFFQFFFCLLRISELYYTLRRVKWQANKIKIDLNFHSFFSICT